MSRFCVLSGLLVAAAQGQVSSVPRPSPLEAFVQQTTTRVTWSMDAGRIDSNESHATVTALDAEDAGQPARRMRGVRVSLTKPDANDQVYLEEDKLDIVKNALDEIATAIHFPGVHPTYMGAQAFWMGWGPPKYALIAQYYFGDAATAAGLEIRPFKPMFQGYRVPYTFPGQPPERFSAALGRAIEALKERDR